MQFRGTPHWQFAKSPHHQRGIIIARDISAGHKERHALAWWPGFLPFTLDDTTLNTERFQSDTNDPHTTIKYRTYRYHSEITNNYDSFITLENMSVFTSLDIELTFDAVYGDLASASAVKVYTENGTDPYDPPQHYEFYWNRADGYFADSDVAGVINPDIAYWLSMSGSDVMLQNSSYLPLVVNSGHSGLPNIVSGGLIHSVDLATTYAEWSDSGTYDPDPAVGENGTYSMATTVELADGYTHLACANDAEALLSSIPLRPLNDTLPMFYGGAGSISMAEWRDPATYTYNTKFCFWGDANDLVTAGDETSACNVACRVYSRHAAAAITINLELDQYSGQIVGYGCPNGDYLLSLFTMDAPTDWWDEPEYKLAIRASESLVNLETGLSDGNIISVTDPLSGFPVNLYYDFETVVPQNDDWSVPTAYAGVYDVGVGVRSFLVPELQTQLTALAKTFGTGWLPRNPLGLSRPTSPY